MAERLTPGVYVQEVSGGIRPIQAVGTSTAGFIGEAPRGIPGDATFVRGFGDFQARFGGHQRGAAGHLAQAVEAFFAAGGSRAFVVRVLPSDATAAVSEDLLARVDDAWGDPRRVLRITARGAGVWAQNLRVRIERATAFPDTALRLDVEWVEGGRSRVVERFDNVVMDPESPDYVVEAVGDTSSYIRVTDLHTTEYLDAEVRLDPPLPDTAATVTTHERAEFRIPVGAELHVRWNGPEGARGDADVVFSAQAATDAGGALDGAEAVLGAGHLHALLAAQLAPALRVLGPGQPAVLTSTAGPWDITGGPAASLEMDGAAQTIPLGPLGAARLQVAAADSALSAGEALTLAVDGTAAQAYNLVAGDVAAAGAMTSAELLGVLNREFSGIRAFLQGGNLVIVSDRPGAGSRLEATGALAQALGAAAGETAADVGGQVIDPAAMTADELAASFNAVLAGAFEARSDGVAVRLVQVDLAAAHSIQWTGDALLFDDATLHEGPAVVGDAVVAIQAPVATNAYLIARLPVGADLLDLTGSNEVTLTVRDGDGGNDVTATLDTAALGTVTLATFAEALTGAVEAAGLDDLIAVSAAGQTLVARTVEPRLAGTRLELAADAATPWVGLQTRDGADGLEVEDQAQVQVVVSERLEPGRPRVLPLLFGASRGVGVSESSSNNPDLRPALTGDQPIRLHGGSDGSEAISPSDFAGMEDASGRTGLRAYDDVDIQLLVMPGHNEPEYLTEALGYADRNDVFFIADGPGSVDRQFQVDTDDVVRFVDGLPLRSDNAAMVYPWLEVSDPVGVGRAPTRFVPPSGHVAGVFARTDRDRGVWKAPAGLEAVIPGALDLQHRLLDADQDLLNPIGLNCIRQRPGAGIVSWGARTLSSDPEWRYVPVRRTALFLKESLRRGLQWVVFEPNDEDLWARIRANIEAFMLGLHRQGAFQGTTAEEAFAVKCDRETNPQELVDQGIVTAQVAFAPLKPAEFVVVLLSQKTLLAA